jgi:ribokinase
MKIAVVGSYGVGMTMRLPKFPVAGETLMGGEYDAGPGGKGSNQAIGAARLGAEVSFLILVL